MKSMLGTQTTVPGQVPKGYLRGTEPDAIIREPMPSHLPSKDPDSGSGSSDAAPHYHAHQIYPHQTGSFGVALYTPGK